MTGEFQSGSGILVVTKDQYDQGYSELLGFTDRGHPITRRHDFELIRRTPEGHFLVWDPYEAA